MTVAEALLSPLDQCRQIWEQDRESANSQRGSTRAVGMSTAVEPLCPHHISELVPSILLLHDFCQVPEDTASPVHYTVFPICVSHKINTFFSLKLPQREVFDLAAEALAVKQPEKLPREDL